MRKINQGREIRKQVPRSDHSFYESSKSRLSPLKIIQKETQDSVPWLLPLRNWRMSQSPLTFYRAGAGIMAGDLVNTPVTCIYTQLCGDAHLSNFGVYASPERNLIFDINDFDETLPGPWEWDLKRLATSFAIAAREKNFSEKEEFNLSKLTAHSYKMAMEKFSRMSHLELWYTNLSSSDIIETFKNEVSGTRLKHTKKVFRKAQYNGHLCKLKSLAEEVNGKYQIREQSSLLIPVRNFPTGYNSKQTEKIIKESFDRYLDSVPDHLKVLLSRYQFRDLAVKVVGVGSVGKRCFIVLLEGRQSGDPLFLQIKESTPSALENYLSKSIYKNHAQRVVSGQRLMQAYSDNFLGWTKGVESSRHFYWRQLSDMKASADIERADLATLKCYAKMCGFALARAHARSGPAEAIAGYIGSNDVFETAMAKFATSYADQNQRDYDLFMQAIKSGKVESSPEA